MNRTAIYGALVGQLAALKAAPYNAVTVSQGFVVWDDAAQQPAIYVVPVKERAEYKMGLPIKWRLSVDVYVYVRQSTSELGVQVLTDLLDGVDAVLSPTGANADAPANQLNKLGGLVQYCAIQGDVEISGGFLNQQQAVARVPVEILVV